MVFLALTGCSTSHVKTTYADQPVLPAKESVETEHVTEAPTLAPPPGNTPEAFHLPTNRITKTN